MRNILFIIITFWASFCGTSLYAYGRTKVVVSQSDDYVKVFSAQNTNYIIKEEINLGGKKVVVGAGSVLVFEGGSLSNGTIVGNNTKVKSRNYEIFKHGVSTYRAYKADTYKYVAKNRDAIIITGSWRNTTCGSNWTGLSSQNSNLCASLAINNFIKLHKQGQEILFPANKEYYVYGRIVCSDYSIDFNNSTIRIIDFNKVEDKSIPLPGGAQPRALRSLYGLLDFNGDNSYIKNLTIDGRASHRNEMPSLGTECLISMASNKNCQLENVVIKDAVGCGICTYAISDCTFDKVSFNGCGEHGIYTHAYKGTLRFNNCRFINCGQDSTLFKQRGASACVKFSGARDQKYAALKDLEAYFTDCLFESTFSQQYVSTFYSDIPYAEFNRCKWKGVRGYSIVTPQLAEQIGRLVEFKFIDCDNPCYSIQSVNTVRRLIRCINVTNPFADTIELTDCDISVSYADVENKYTEMYAEQYDTPVVCTNCNFIKGSEDTPIRNTIKNPRPMVFYHCIWNFADLQADKYRGSYFLVLSNTKETRKTTRFVMFKYCQINLAKYRMLYCHDTDISFLDCEYIDSYDSMVDAKETPNRACKSPKLR